MSEPGVGEAGERSLTAGMLAGRELLVRELEAMDDADADATANRIFAAAAADRAEPTADELAELVKALDGAFARLSGAVPGAQAVMDDALRVADRDAERPVEMLAGKSGTGGAIVRVAAGLSLLLIVAKTEVNLDWRSGDAQFRLTAGIPSGFKDLASTLVALVAGAAGSKESPSGGGSAPSPPDLQAPNVLSPLSSASLLPLNESSSRLPSEKLDFAEGLEVRDAFLALLAGREEDIAAAAERACGPIFHSALMGFAKPRRGDGERLPFGPPLRFGVGLMPVNPPRGSDEELRYRIAVRVQSEREIKPKIVRWMAERFKALTPLASLRWTSPVICLGSNDEGDYLPWSGPLPDHGKIVSGAPLNVAGCAIGACTLIVEKAGEMFALSAGHPIRDVERAAAAGTAVYCRPQAGGGPLPRARIGEVYDSSVFDRVRPGAPAGGGRTADFALIKLDRDAAPRNGGGNLVNGRAVVGPLFPVSTVGTPDEEVRRSGLYGRSVTKSAAKSPALTGHLNAVALQFECVDRIVAGSVMATGLIEVVMAPSAPLLPQPGDSGALLSTTAEDGSPRPLALLFGAQTAGRLDKINSKEKVTASLYGAPLSAIAPMSEMRIT